MSLSTSLDVITIFSAVFSPPPSSIIVSASVTVGTPTAMTLIPSKDSFEIYFLLFWTPLPGEIPLSVI
jgi:hypothetical protein